MTDMDFKQEEISMFCENCGAKLKEDDRFCPECGTPVKVSSDAGREQGQQTYQQPGYDEQQTYQQPEYGGQQPYQQPGFSEQQPYRQPEQRQQFYQQEYQEPEPQDVYKRQAFNADFDGDQMAVHLPLSVEAQAECRFLLLSPNNLLKPSDGGPVAVPSQDMVLGIYYLTQERPGEIGEGKFFKNVNEAILAYENGYIKLQTRITVRCQKKMADGTILSRNVESTLGRFLFNEILPQDLGFVDRSVEGNELLLEVDFHVGKKQLKQILEKVINTHGATKTAEVLDSIKAMGYKYSTRAAMTVSISDMTVPPQKPELIAQAQDTVDKITRNYKRGLITDEERYKEVVETWKNTDDTLTKALLSGLDKYNNIFMMADSGARGSDKQIKQLAGMRGLMADTTGHTIELPIKSNFREGLDVLEYFM